VFHSFIPNANHKHQTKTFTQIKKFSSKPQPVSAGSVRFSRLKLYL